MSGFTAEDGKFPRFNHNAEAMEFLCETLRMLTFGMNDPDDVRKLMEPNLAARQANGAMTEAQSRLMRAIVESTVAHARGHAPQISVEFGRCSLPPSIRPSYQELEEHLTNLPPD